ncbi:hypothetical protein [Actinoplanes sp. N902-109]|uniref:hypothetical protein n=1 Tax=Actinoplanes sp. (strain N902-109) TaxID=649831 RepID=UPI00032954BD|nr:hypothetical protein [Actinoplanes sp. N902-109]AGL15095.1 hypothetical protein L083_1585 [Actinoplanes sp. N902-109]
MLLAVFVVALGVVLVPRLLNGNDSNTPAPVADAHADPLATAVEKCDPAKAGMQLSDSNKKLTINGAGIGANYSAGLDEDALNCAFDTLGVPGALSDRMSSTVEADGRLEGEWPGYSVTWTNSKAKGLDMVVTATE